MNSFYEQDNFQSATHKPFLKIWYPENGMYKIAAVKTIANRRAQQLPGSFYFPLKSRYKRVAKRCFDLAVSIILIPLLLSWMIPLFAILIKLDSGGPVFFFQNRNKNGGKLFSCIKFRTMTINAEADMLIAKVNDCRITMVGKFLRRFHLDELPQLFNVLMGDMSIIGPRPYMVNENLYYEDLLESYSRRHLVKPGITGLAQSSGYFGPVHGLKRVKERFELDIQYINNWSLAMDLKILGRTLRMIYASKRQQGQGLNT